MKAVIVFALIFVAVCTAQNSNGLGSKPIPAVGVSGAHVVKGFAWDDLNRNGVYDAGEPMVPGMSVSLYYDSRDLWSAVPSTLIGTQQTDRNGMFMFECLNSGRYSTQIWGLPEGYEYTTPGQGHELVDSDAVLVDTRTGLAQSQSFYLRGPERTTYEIGIGITQIVYVGALQGFVWSDSNYNGIQETTEFGTPGVIVTLTMNGAVVASMESDMDGIFYFEQLQPGLYRLSFDLTPLGPGYAFTEPFKGTVSSRDSDVYQETGSTGDFEILRGILITDIDAGIIPSPGFLSAYYWIDQNKDGLQSADEPGIEGMDVEIYASTGDLVRTVTTDANGRFELEIDSISYYLQAIYDPESMIPTFAFAGNAELDSEIDDNGRSPLLTVRPGQLTTLNGGFVPLLSTVQITVFRDTNDDNVFNMGLGDSYATDYTVSLYSADSQLVQTAQTGSNGRATFDDLEGGSYYLELSLPGAEWGFVDPQANGANGVDDSDITVINGLVGRTAPFSLGVGELRTDFGAGFKRLFSSIRGLVFQDFNRNGLRDPVDSIIPGIVVYLLDSEGILSSAETDSTGDFFFDKLDAATYGLQIADESLQGWIQAPANVGTNEVIDSDFPADGSPVSVELGINEQYCCVDAGLSSETVLPASIIGFVWDDYNARTGIQTGNDVPISGIQISLKNSAGVTATTATSNSQGVFQFNDVPPGRYEMTVVLSVHTLSPFHAGTDGNRDSDFTANSNGGTTGLFDVVEGVNITNLDLGLIPRDGGIQGKVWFDSTPDGIFKGETGLAGVSVSLWGVENGQRTSSLRTVKTSSTGAYSFTGVRPADYQIFVDRPSTAWVFSAKNQGGNAATDSDVNPDTGFTDNVKVSAQLTTSNIDAALRLA